MLTLIALSAALMQDPPAPPPQELHGRFVVIGSGLDGPGDIDADGDGQVTREEFAAPLNDAFARLDKDSDGRLSSEELMADRGPGYGGVTIHRRGDGDVERFELSREGPGGERPFRIERDDESTVVFIRPDRRDEDARVTVRTLSDDDGPRVIHFDHGPDGLRDGRIVVRTLDGPGHGPDDLDRDGDGKVSEAEFTAPLRDAFARMDADHSGFIDNGEDGGENQIHIFARRLDIQDDE